MLCCFSRMKFYFCRKKMLGKSSEDFPFAVSDVILAKCEKEVYYAKIVSINHLKRTAVLLFDDSSKEKVHFENIFSGKSFLYCIECLSYTFKLILIYRVDVSQRNKRALFVLLSNKFYTWYHRHQLCLSYSDACASFLFMELHLYNASEDKSIEK